MMNPQFRQGLTLMKLVRVWDSFVGESAWQSYIETVVGFSIILFGSLEGKAIIETDRFKNQDGRGAS